MKSMNGRSFLFLIAVILVTACSLRQEAELVYGHRGPVDIKLEKGTPLFAFLSDSACTLETALPDMGKVKFWINGKSEDELVEFDFSGISGKGLGNPYALGAYMDYEWNEQYQNCSPLAAHVFHCEGSRVSVSEGRAIPFCKSGPFPKDSLENIALVSMAALLQTGRFYDIVSSKKWSRSLDLLIHPRFLRHAQDEAGTPIDAIDVDNARWSARGRPGGGDFTIEILPPSERFVSYFRKIIALQLGVVAHEFSHHFFYSRAPELFKVSQESGIESSVGFPIAYLSPSEQTPSRKVDLGIVIDAINEGYADLMAHYAFSSGNFPFWTGIELGYFKKARLIKEEQTGHPTEVKQINNDVLKHFFRPYFKGPRDPDQPNHQDVHTIGAIYAHALDTLFKEKLGASDLSPQSKNKAILLNKWIDRLRELYFAHAPKYKKDPQKFLEDSAFAAVQLCFPSEDESRGVLTKGLCEVIKAKFPAYVERWKGRYVCQ